MKKKIRLATVMLSGTMVAAAFGGGAVFAADAESFALPAVSAPNGKLELGGGYSEIDDLGDDALIYGGASFSLPVGDAFGFQADFAASHQFEDTIYGGAAHFFTRDPNSYLIGIVGGAGFSENANLYFIGPEVELYAGNFTLEAWGGYMNLDVDGLDSSDELFAQVDLALYATDNLRFSVGVSSVAEFESANVAMEWLIADTGLPLALTAKGEFGEDDYMAVSAGLKIYFGADDSKSLIRRHREDDPRNRGLDAFGSAGSAYSNQNNGGNGNGGEEGGGGEECFGGEEGDPYCYPT